MFKMKKLIIFFIISMLLINMFSLTVGAKSDPQSITQSNLLEAKKGIHPRVFITTENLPQMKARMTDERYSDLAKGLLTGVDKIIAFDPPAYNMKGEVTDGFMRYNVGNNLANIGAAYLFTGDEKYLKAAEKWVTAACNYPFWGRQEGVVNSDIIAGHMLYGVALLYDWCYDGLKPETRELVERTLLERGTAMYKASFPDSTAFWKLEWLQNHMWINMTGLTIAGLALYDKYPEVSKWFDQANTMMAKTMELLGDDGASHEGVGYWSYGMEWLLYYMDISRDFFNKDYYSTEWFKKTAQYAQSMFLPENSLTNTNNHVNIGDDDLNFNLGTGPNLIFAKLAKEYKDGNAQRTALLTSKNGVSVPKTLWTNIAWFDLDVKENPATSSPLTNYFDDMDIFTSRSSWSGDEGLMVFKSGPYMGHKVTEVNDTNPVIDWGSGHVHPDANHFVWFAGGDWQFVDDGYSHKYTNSHNTLLVDGRGQLGEGSIWFNGIDAQTGGSNAKIIKTESAAAYDYVAGDAATAYPSMLGLKKYVRHMVYIKPDVLIVIDDIATKDPKKLELRFFPNAQTAVEQGGGSFYIQNANSKLLAKPLATNGGKFEAKKVSLFSGRENASYSTPQINVEKLALVASNETNEWTNAMSFAYSPNGQKPPQVDLVSNKDGEYVVKVNQSTYRINIKTGSVKTDELQPQTSPSVTLDGKLLSDVNPRIDGNMTLLPLRAIAEKAGKSVKWYEEMGSAMVGKVVISPEKGTVWGNGDIINTAMKVEDGKIFISQKGIEKVLGVQTRLRDSLNLVEISSDVKGNTGKDASLASAEIKGTGVAGFSPDKYEYSVFKTWSDGDEVLKVIPEDINAEASIQYQKDKISVTVTSGDKSNSKTYNFNFKPFMSYGSKIVQNITASGYLAGSNPELTMDQDLSTIWASEGDSQWIQFDFGKQEELSFMAIAASQGNTRKAKFEIYISQDGTNYKEMFRGTSSGTTAGPEYYPLNGEKARFVKLVGHGNTKNLWNSFSEIGFYGNEKFVKTFTMSAEKNSILKGEKASITLSGNMSDDTPIDFAKANVEFTSSDSNVATVENGNIVTKNKGDATISAVLTVDGISRSQTIKISVYDYVLVDDNFDSYTDGLPLPTPWRTVFGDPRNQVTAAKTDKGLSMRINYNDGGKNPNATFKLNGIKGKVVYEADVMSDTTLGNKQIELYDSKGKLFSPLLNFSSSGDVTAYDVDTPKSIFKYSPNQWYHFKVELDVDKQTFDAYIDGVKCASGYAFRNANGAYDWSGGLTGVRMDIYSADNDKINFYVDNLKVYVPK